MIAPITRHAAICLVCLCCCTCVRAASIYLRARIIEPAGQRFKVSAGGHPHEDPWAFQPPHNFEATGNAWSQWVNLSDWKWHGRHDREGGIAEWPSMMLTIEREPADAKQRIKG